MVFLGKNRRTKQLANSAGIHGFHFEGDIDTTPKEKFAPLRLFTFRIPRIMKNVLKHSDHQIWIFDYEYSIYRDQDVGQTVAMIEMRKTRWPPTVIEARKKERFTVAAMRVLTQKIANWQLDYKEVDLSIHPEFAERYRAFCKNNPENFSRLLTPQLLDFLVQNPGWNIETMDQWLLLYRHGQYIKPKEFNIFFNSILAIYKMIENDFSSASFGPLR